MAFRLIRRPQTQLVTEALARKFAEMESVNNERALKRIRIENYKKLLHQGLFLPVRWACATCLETGGIYRVNGNHTSHMLLEVFPFPSNFYAIVEEYECETLADMNRLWSNYDSKDQSRTNGEINKIIAGGDETIKNISGKILNLAASGMAYHLWKDDMWNKRRHSVMERAELLIENPKFVVWLNDLLRKGRTEESRGDSWPLKRVPVVAAIFGTYTRDSGTAYDFWTDVKNGLGKSGCVTRLLEKWLLSTRLKVNDTGRGRGNRLAGDKTFYIVCLKHWNAYVNGRRPKAINYEPGEDIPNIA
jgi:hypothetical protein